MNAAGASPEPVNRRQYQSVDWFAELISVPSFVHPEIAGNVFAAFVIAARYPTSFTNVEAGSRGAIVPVLSRAASAPVPNHVTATAYDSRLSPDLPKFHFNTPMANDAVSPVFTGFDVDSVANAHRSAPDTVSKIP